MKSQLQKSQVQMNVADLMTHQLGWWDPMSNFFHRAQNPWQSPCWCGWRSFLGFAQRPAERSCEILKRAQASEKAKERCWTPDNFTATSVGWNIDLLGNGARWIQPQPALLLKVWCNRHFYLTCPVFMSPWFLSCSFLSSSNNNNNNNWLLRLSSDLQQWMLKVSHWWRLMEVDTFKSLNARVIKMSIIRTVETACLRHRTLLEVF